MNTQSQNLTPPARRGPVAPLPMIYVALLGALMLTMFTMSSLGEKSARRYHQSHRAHAAALAK